MPRGDVDGGADAKADKADKADGAARASGPAGREGPARDRHALRSAMARRFNFVFRRFEKRFFGRLFGRKNA